MIRIGLILLLLTVLCLVVFALVGEPGRASLEWLGWQVEMTAVTAALLVIFGGLAGGLGWRLIIWIAEAPERARKVRAEARRRQGSEALARGFLAAAAGDGSEARRLAQKAAGLVEDAPALVRVLAAQAAEAAGDAAAANQAYTAMLGFPEMRLAGLKGLMQTALLSNDRPAALRYAQEAYALAKTSRWAWRALLEDRLEAGDWAQALDLVKSALDRKIVSPAVADRARAALLAASAASLEEQDDKGRARALDFAQQSVKLKPDFAPAVVIAARLLAAAGKGPRAVAVLEAAWKQAPHPALWLAYRDLRTHETPKERAVRLEALAALNAEARESRILMVEQALIAGAPAAIRKSVEALAAEPATSRICGLRARAALALGEADEARAWVARAANAPAEPEWSDIAPDGRAFAYTPTDWARLVSNYAETGELIHPRFERRERTIREVPDLPVAYAAAGAIVRAAETGLAMPPLPDEADHFADAFEEALDPGPAQPRPSGERRPTSPRRRLATGPRTAK